MSAPEQTPAFIVEMFHRINRLRAKAGGKPGDSKTGFIDPRAIARAQKVVEDKEDGIGAEIEAGLARIGNAWEDLQKSAVHMPRLRSDANNIKDLADTYHYQLLAHFGESLRDFCEKLDVGNKAHHTIVQAHIDAMLAAHRLGIRGHGGPQAAELKQMVARAIEKHG